MEKFQFTLTKVLQWMAFQLAKHWPRRCCPRQVLLQSSIQPLQLVGPSNSAENYFHGYFLKCHLKLLKLPLIFNFNIKQISSPPKPWWIEMRKALIQLTTLVKPKALLSFSIFSSNAHCYLQMVRPQNHLADLIFLTDLCQERLGQVDTLPVVDFYGIFIKTCSLIR